MEIEDSLRKTEKWAHDGPSMKDGLGKTDKKDYKIANGNPLVCETIRCSGAIHSLEYGKDPDLICKRQGCLNCKDSKCTSCEENNAILLNIDGSWFCFTILDIFNYYLKHYNTEHYSKLPVLPDDVKTPVPELGITIPGYIVLVCIMIMYDDFSPVYKLTFYAQMNNYLIGTKLGDLNGYEIVQTFNLILKYYILPFVYIQKDTLQKYISRTFTAQILPSLIHIIQEDLGIPDIPPNYFIAQRIVEQSRGQNKDFLEFFIENFFKIADDSPFWESEINNIIRKGEHLVVEDDSSDEVCEDPNMRAIRKILGNIELEKY